MSTSCLRRSSTGCVAAIGILLIAACGGDDSSSPSANDAGQANDASSSGDVGALPDATSSGDASATNDANPGPDALATDSALAPDTAPADSGREPEDATIGPDASDDGGATSEVPIADGQTDAPDTGSNGPDASAEAGGLDAAFSKADSDSDAPLDLADAPGDGATTPDDAADAGDAVAGVAYDFEFTTDLGGWWLQQVTPGFNPDGGPWPLFTNSGVSWSSTMGDPAGSMKVDAAFDDGGEKLTVALNFPFPYVDFTGKKVTVSLFLAGGNPAYFYVFAQDQSWDWKDNGAMQFPAVAGGTWFTATLDMTSSQGFTSAGFDYTHVRLLGIEFDSGGGSGPGSIFPATIYVDNITVQ
jgi:hypothetical protein